MKYEFVPGDEITIAPGRTVKRIRALIAIGAFGVAPGDLGGYGSTAMRWSPAMRGSTAMGLSFGHQKSDQKTER